MFFPVVPTIFTYRALPKRTREASNTDGIKPYLNLQTFDLAIGYLDSGRVSATLIALVLTKGMK